MCHGDTMHKSKRRITPPSTEVRHSVLMMTGEKEVKNMDTYKKLLQECYSLICQPNVRAVKDFISIVEKSELTKLQFNYIIRKINSYIGYYYDNIADPIYYSSLNNNERSDTAAIRRACMYIRHMDNSLRKGKLYVAVFNTVKHSKNRYGQDLYKELMLDIYNLEIIDLRRYVL